MKINGDNIDCDHVEVDCVDGSHVDGDPVDGNEAKKKAMIEFAQFVQYKCSIDTSSLLVVEMAQQKWNLVILKSMTYLCRYWIHEKKMTK